MVAGRVCQPCRSVADDPALPRILLIGDSISRGYTLPVRRALAGKANVHRAPENCGPTAQGLNKLSVWLGDGRWDLIHFNFGIHDRASDPTAYAERLEKLVNALKATGATLVWESSTPVSGKLAGPDGQDSMPALNRAAAAVMARHGIPVSDLYALMAPRLAAMQGDDGCHFNGPGYEFLGKAVAARLLEALPPTR
jgi:lysophospholipase L1-like esterase